ncbi:hypothetical protein BDV38DRAFT_260340 [Aspergillus pseudotamarii]|uniref:Uncharacterized protein n=1 Tax=Aspergillus pseudotamarii TaxID=132259 RepID=A0A5N6SFS7_ASPPS|nr:uncharacterized protein BDV38DRAFT_260340 [Aspergillus pseudotamarii]KAE8132719.1 hypothetical protein BDV38DRAFT_260340 [Aspergillus pseudotamarii]
MSFFSPSRIMKLNQVLSHALCKSVMAMLKKMWFNTRISIIYYIVSHAPCTVTLLTLHQKQEVGTTADVKGGVMVTAQYQGADLESARDWTWQRTFRALDRLKGNGSPVDPITVTNRS